MILAGLDLSLTCTGLVAANTEWGGLWPSVLKATMTADPLSKLKRGEIRIQTAREQHQRIARLAMKVAQWCTDLRSANKGPLIVYIEERAFSKHNSANGQTAELHAIVKFQLLRADVDFSLVPSTEVRALLLGKVPRRGQDAKDAVQATFRASGCPIDWGQDLTDAACVLNWAMSQHGGHFFATPRLT